MYHAKVEIACLPSNVNSNSFRSKWSKYAETKKWDKLVKEAFKGMLPTNPIKTSKISYRRYSSGILDWDNLVGCFKHVQDGLVSAGIIIDDGVKSIPEMPTYSQEKCKRGQGKITIEVLELP